MADSKKRKAIEEVAKQNENNNTVDREVQQKRINRKQTAQRDRQWQTVDSGDDESNINSEEVSFVKGTTKDEIRETDSSNDSRSTESSTSDKKKNNSKKEHKKNKKESKKKDKHSKSRKSKKDKKDKKKKHSHHDNVKGYVNQNEYGKYGIIKDEHFFQKQREFEVYMDEVKGMPGIMGQSKKEVMQHFKSFIEDYNTATMPDEKYYNYERWEMEDYQNKKNIERMQQEKRNNLILDNESNSVFNDEEVMRQERKRLKQLAEQKEFNETLLKVSHNKGLQENMKRQAELTTELQQAYKRGDTITVKRIERLLAPEEEKVRIKHPWG
eukprot:gene12253-16428_t